ncbi:hypothetical protein QTP88_018201 [Uroleucon formosanum]
MHEHRRGRLRAGGLREAVGGAGTRNTKISSEHDGFFFSKGIEPDGKRTVRLRRRPFVLPTCPIVSPAEDRCKVREESRELERERVRKREIRLYRKCERKTNRHDAHTRRYQIYETTSIDDGALLNAIGLLRLLLRYCIGAYYLKHILSQSAVQIKHLIDSFRIFNERKSPEELGDINIRSQEKIKLEYSRRTLTYVRL